MSFVSESERRQVMEECFSGHMSRNCKYCPAHPENGGTCCFGSEKFDDNDKECSDCIHHDECQQEAVDREAERQHLERYYGSQRDYTPRKTVRLPVIQSNEPRRVVRVATQSNSGPVPSRFAVENQLEKPRPRLITQNTSYPATRPTAIPMKVEPKKPEETLFARFLKDFVWGGLQGAFEMAVEFFRNHRLP